MNEISELVCYLLLILYIVYIPEKIYSENGLYIIISRGHGWKKKDI